MQSGEEDLDEIDENKEARQSNQAEEGDFDHSHRYTEED